jgi:hypothetical protein
MRTYRLYQVGIVSNIPYLTFIAETTATDESAAEDTLLASLPTDNVEYLITVVK